MPPPRPHHTGRNAAIAGVVIVVVVILLVGGAGYIPGFPSFLKPSGGGKAAPTYAVTFTESGLPSGMSWSVTLSGHSRSSTTGVITFTEANGSYAYTVGSVSGYTASPSSGTVTVNGAPATEAIAFTAVTPGTYPVTFIESGLATGTSWSVTFNGATQSATGSSIVFTAPNGTYAFSVGAVSGYTASPSSGSVTVSGAAATQAVTFTGTSPSKYAVTFTESGLPSGTSWSATLNGATSSSTTSTIAFSEANGTYSFSIGGGAGYVASPSSGSVTVRGAAASVSITFTTSYSGAQYPVTFTQTGLPGNESWSATLTNLSSTTPTLVFSYIGVSGQGSTIEFSAPGTTHYVFSIRTTDPYYSVSPSIGNLSVGTAPVHLSVVFSLLYSVHFPVTFVESGLPAGSTWGLVFNGTSLSGSAGAPLAASVSNGSYFFSDVSTSAAGYGPEANASGVVFVNGRGLTVEIPFGPTHLVSFVPKGLPAGGSWSVDLNGSFNSSVGGDINFTVANGIYPFTVAPPSGYQASPVNGTVSVRGAATSVTVSFSVASTYTLTFREVGLPSGWNWSVYVPQVPATKSATAPASISFSLYNGYVEWSAYVTNRSTLYVPTNPSGSLTINGSGVVITVYFAKTAVVTFQETGLPSGGFWFIYAFTAGPSGRATSNFSSSSTLTLALPNGNYSWEVLEAGNSTTGQSYFASPAAGGFSLDGAPLTIAISFTSNPSLHYVVFSQFVAQLFGLYPLPNGTVWGVTLNGQSQTTTGTVLIFLVPNGTYSFTLIAPSGYVGVPANGNLTVNFTGTAILFRNVASVALLFRPTGSVPAPFAATSRTEFGIPYAEWAIAAWARSEIARPVG